LIKIRSGLGDLDALGGSLGRSSAADILPIARDGEKEGPFVSQVHQAFQPDCHHDSSLPLYWHNLNLEGGIIGYRTIERVALVNAGVYRAV
jgi:hypothetical protein